jgi:bacterioferritin-associated ferredoxin
MLLDSNSTSRLPVEVSTSNGRYLHHHGRFPALMIVCSCNVLSDHDVRHAVNSVDNLPLNAKQIYGCLDCNAECGRCARTIKGIIDEALASAARPRQFDGRHARLDLSHAPPADDARPCRLRPQFFECSSDEFSNASPRAQHSQ